MDRAPSEPSAEITLLLQKWQTGDRVAFDQLIPLVYPELHLIASRYMSHERRDGSLQTTGLLHEAYVKLVDQRNVNWQSRAHFFAIAAHLMRRILLDHARRRQRDKRGGGAVAVSLDDLAIPSPDSGDAIDVIAV